MSPRSPRVLIVRLSAIGDVLHAMPAVAGLRDQRPTAQIDWLVEDRAAALLEGHPHLDRVFVFPRRLWKEARRRPWALPRAIGATAALLGRLLARRYDAALDLQGNLKSGVFTLLSGAPVRVGLAREEAREGNGFFVNLRTRPARGRPPHRTDRAAAVVSALLGEDVAPRPSPIPRPASAVASVDVALRAAGLPERGYAVLHPGTSGFGAFKRWPAERFARLAERIVRESGVPVAITGARDGDDARLVADVRASARVATAALATEDLVALAEALRRARVFVSADTGPLHVAAAVGTPLVGLFGPKDEAVYGPLGPGGDGRLARGDVVARGDVACRPCALRWCPDPVCMTGIEVDEVFQRIRPALAGSASAS